MKKTLIFLIFISNAIIGMSSNHEHIPKTHFHLNASHFSQSELRSDIAKSSAGAAISDQPVHLQNNGIQYLSNGADGAGVLATYKDEFKQVSQISFKEEVVIQAVNAKIQDCMRFTDIKGILDYQSELEGKLYDTHPNEHEAILAELGQIDYQLETKLAPWVECYLDCKSKRLKGDWDSLNRRHSKLESELKNPDLSDEEYLKLKQEKDIVGKALYHHSTTPLMTVHEGDPQAALTAWKTIEQWRKNGQIDSETFQAAKDFYLQRKDVHELEDSAAQSEQFSKATVLENTSLAPSISEQLAVESSIALGKLENVTDMTTDKPTIWYGNELSAEKKELFAAYHQEVHESLILEGLIDRDMPRAIQVADLFIETLAHELHPNQIKRDIDGIAQLSSYVAKSAMSPINGVQGKSNLGHPHPRVIAALEAGVGGAQEIARKLVTPMEGVDKSPLVQLLRAAGDLTPEQIAIISAKATADWIKFEALSAVGSYVSQADVLGKVREAARRVEKGTLTVEEARRALIADGIVLDVGAAESSAASAAESTAVLRSQSDKVRGASKASGAGKAKPLDYGHSAIQYQELKGALEVEEFTSVVKVTKHGLERLIGRKFQPNELLNLFSHPDFVKIQADGSKAFIKQIGIDKYNLVVINESTREVVTALRNINKKALLGLGGNYGWTL